MDSPLPAPFPTASLSLEALKQSWARYAGRLPTLARVGGVGFVQILKSEEHFSNTDLLN